MLEFDALLWYLKDAEQKAQKGEFLMETALKIRNILFRAFIINIVAVLIVWLLYHTGLYYWILALFGAGFRDISVGKLLIYSIALWKLLGIVLFLIPAAAIHWEYKCLCCCKEKKAKKVKKTAKAKPRKKRRK